MDVNPVLPKGRPFIERYGPGGFRIGGTIYTGSVLILPDGVEIWPISSMAEITPESLRPVAEHGGVEILLIGCGQRMQMVQKPLRAALREVGVVIDAMDSGAVCRTYNVLVAEERRVAAALLPLTA
ncbi:MAG TPA: Mth938-like domain-containing protein [Aliidongia sp.]|nr:Mth938-like domain-containing protein [Aliidongia sp.]